LNTNLPKLCLVAIILIWRASNGAAQSNQFVDPRTFHWETVPPATNAFTVTSKLALSVSSRDASELAVIERLSKEGGLQLPPADSRFERAFKPHSFRFGHAEVTCSIVTAIKRRNPLCLLNPIILNIQF
jgi:hypothetical protein